MNMKEFFRMVLAVVCGLFIAGIIAFILGALILNIPGRKKKA